MKTYYEILGVKENASSKEIKVAYKSLMKKYHPDVFKGDAKSAQKISAEINNAYDTLCNAQLRKEYDQSLQEQREQEAKQGYSYYNYSTQNKSYTNYQNNNYRKESPADIYSRILRNKRGFNDNYSNSYSYRTINNAQNYVQKKLISLSNTQLLLVALAVVFICFIGLILSLFDMNKLANINKNNNTISNTQSYNTYYYPPNNSINYNNSYSLEDIMINYGFDLFFDSEYEFQIFIMENEDLLRKYLSQEITQTQYFEELYKRAEEQE